MTLLWLMNLPMRNVSVLLPTGPAGAVAVNTKVERWIGSIEHTVHGINFRAIRCCTRWHLIQICPGVHTVLSAVLQDVTSCNLLDVCRSYWGTSCLHRLSWSVSPVNSYRSRSVTLRFAYCLLLAPAYSSSVEIGALGSSETSVNASQTTRSHNQSSVLFSEIVVDPELLKSKRITPWLLVRKWTIQTERPPLVDEI
jgi:hypothetical protein